MSSLTIAMRIRQLPQLVFPETTGRMGYESAPCELGLFNGRQLQPAPLPAGGLALNPIKVADANQVDIGQYVAVIGYPGVGGDTITLTDGKIAGVEDIIRSGASYQRQLAVAQAHDGDLVEVARSLAAEMRAGRPLPA